MANERITQFLEVVRQDVSLQERMKTATDQVSGARLAVQLGAEKGYHFTAAEVEEWMQSQSPTEGELSDRELEQVSGGGVFGDWPKDSSALDKTYGGC